MKEDVMRKLIIIGTLTLAVAAVAGCSAGGGGESGATGGGGSAVDGGTVESQVSGRVTNTKGGAFAAARPIDSSVPQIGPRIVKTASLRLSVRRGRFDDAVDEASSVAAGLGGFVVSSSASQGSHGRLVRGTLVVRIPASKYSDAMRSLAGLGRVEGRQESGQDVSQEYVDLKARARQLQAVETQLLELLGRANTVGAALAVQQQLSQVQLDLEQAKGRLQYLDDQVAFATISLDLHERVVAGSKSGDSFSVVGTWAKAAHGFLAVIGWTFVVLATAAPIILILGLVFLLGRVALRKSFRPLRRPAA
jgi:Domain of unknown function (DUF4349)